ncbi:iron-sulfur cluster assembly scaffold protein [Mycoplasma phocimorsus]|uniref:Iron-sulfur cluster assembly scaffold protein n=1 Tax=Mycoplasma phocimorsus TaxID=3045839 RepID=A0AAJ1PUF4_9MOLU|nr:iron-sulfur cluster assembly scaffold protein [Mycoplasma phocimorsus]MDJ1646026.1 iron-sulfur cluster assembly scaffold protein [Mycoplasma phocimorsus]MDJ1646307.1 iron-sulfur cluster assembly scaffold protein [Mycoplasma phocimorsus]MDJ1647879.1 iron-sulfur cluster assembly scaffold protein [Mycoplasma phocimorsus]MDJ1648421.1 iron-sulfur cluster assembly scaffold protein [Mycoplasma phocimorsus]
MIIDQKYKIQLITSRYSNPKFANNNLTEEDNFTKYSNRCVDKIILKMENKDSFYFFEHKTNGCAICVASSDIMIETINNKTKDEILNILQKYNQLINMEIKYENIIGDLNVFNNVKTHLNRYDCANLIYLAVKERIEK